jgi:hypothetical protein
VLGTDIRFFATGGGGCAGTIDLSSVSNLCRISLKSSFFARASSFDNLNNFYMNPIKKKK